MIKKTRIILFSALALNLSLAPACAQDVSQNNAPQLETLPEYINQIYPDLEALYRDLHRHPELAFQETRTASLLAREMRSLGFEVTENIGKTGIIAVLKNGNGPTVFVRTDMDGLPMKEETGLPYTSQVDDAPWQDTTTAVAHSCGHDIHMSAWIGTARALTSLKQSWSGTLVFIGQPAEEILGGAKAMIEDGLFSKIPKPDAGFALHVAPFPAGTVILKDGPVYSASDKVDIVFKGRGGHGSMPHVTIDPIVIASRFVTDIQAITSREKDANEFGVITVGAFNAGTVANIIPDSATLKLSLRSHKPEIRELLLDGVRRTAKSAAAAAAGAPEPEIIVKAGTGVSINDSLLSANTAAVFEEAFGKKFQFVPAMVPPVAGSEDYAEFVNAGVSSAYFMLGSLDPELFATAKAEGKSLPFAHSSQFSPVPEPTIKTGVHAMTLAVLGALEKKQ